MPVKYDKSKVIRPESQVLWTTEMVQEFSQARADVHYFANNHCRVAHPIKGIIQLEPRDYQKRMLKLVSDNDMCVLNCPRQIGKSTIIGLYCLWVTIFASEKKPVEVWVLSNKGSSAQSFLDDIKGTYEELEPYLKCNAGVVEWNKTSIEFENGSKIKTGTTSKDTIRGESPTFLVLDEFAHVPAHIAEEFYTAVEPSLAKGGKMVIISTPNGNNGKFYDLYSNAGTTSKESENGFARYEMAWDEPPGRDEDFKKERIKRTSLQQWNQEYEAKFLGSSDTLIDGNALERLGKLLEEPNYEYDELTLWEKPRKDNLYVLSCDVAKGVQKDSSVIQILNVTNPEMTKQAGVWSSNEIDPFDFTEKIYEVARMFNDAFVVIENNTYGHEVGRRLFDEFQYENIYKEKKQKHWGIYADKRKKLLGTSFLKKHLESHILHIKDRDTYSEICNFIELSPDIYGCPKGKNNHDDRVMSLVWGIFFIETDYWKEWSEYLRVELAGKNGGIAQNINDIYDPIICEQEAGPVYDEDGFREDGWMIG